MRNQILLSLVLIVLVLCLFYALPTVAQPANKIRSKEGKKNKRNKKDEPPERTAIRLWANSLTDNDYKLEYWKEIFHSTSASDFFNGYASKISKIFKEAGAKVNFALVGACDGTGDKTIKNIYVPNDHWRGVFVEPMSINVRDLIKFISEKSLGHRSMVIRAAATSSCPNATIMVERPLYEEKNKTIPHWLRRQIGSVLPSHRDHARKEWTLEEVRCVTPPEILKDWSMSTSSGILANAQPVNPLKPSKKNRIRRPHVLKIDVEGHDFEVLMGFLQYNTPPEQLPLIIDFEAKSIAKKYPAAKARMEDLGYAVTPFGQDGFAILNAEHVLQSIQEGHIPNEEEPDI